MESVRIDRWLWAVRLFKTRSQATEACRAGHVRVGEARAKPATPVRVGDTVHARVHGRERVVEVTQLIEKRVSASAAAECLIDHTPPPPEPTAQPTTLKRPRGAGRPTKRERRQLEREFGRRR